MADRALGSPFRRGVVAWLAGVSACSLALTVAFLVAQPEDEVASWGADSFSRSALGHRAFVELLRREGVPVVVSRYASGERAGARALLLVAEPQLAEADPARPRRMRSMLAAAGNVLLVLPKWRGARAADRPGWVEAVEPIGDGAIQRTLAAAGVASSVSHPAGPQRRCEGSPAEIAWRQPQLLRPAAGLRPLVTCPDGILLAEAGGIDGRRLLVLSDPDAIANHSLDEGGHAALALEIVARARAAGQAVIVDETLHGHERPPVLWRELFAYPLLPAVVQAGLALLALVLSGLARFGAPVPALAALGSGKSLLIENTASLLRRAGHSAYTLGRYLDATTAEVGRALRAPPPRAAGELHAWLRAAGRRRGVRIDIDRLRAQVDAARQAERASPSAVLAAARRVHRWKQEMLSGSRHHTAG